jgi:hypothetical protein
MGSLTRILPKLLMNPNLCVSLVLELIESLKTRTSVKSTAAITARIFFFIGHVPSVEVMIVSAPDAKFGTRRQSVLTLEEEGYVRIQIVILGGHVETQLIILFFI